MLVWKLLNSYITINGTVRLPLTVQIFSQPQICLVKALHKRLFGRLDGVNTHPGGDQSLGCYGSNPVIDPPQGVCSQMYCLCVEERGVVCERCVREGGMKIDMTIHVM